MPHRSENLSNETIIQQTKSWINEFVIGLHLCPFAERVFEKDHIDYTIADHDQVEQHLQLLEDIFNKLDNVSHIETSLLIFADSYASFEDYLDFLQLCNLLLEDLGYVGDYQLASFHPEYCFADSTSDDASNFSNRSPYPMLHILRERSIELATANYPDIDAVPERNIKRLQQIGIGKLIQKLHRCRQENG